MIIHQQLFFETSGNKVTYFNVMEECRKFIRECGVQNGILVVQSPHTTCAVFLEEMVHDFDALGDEYLQADLNKGLNKVFPKQMTYDDDYKYPGVLHLSQGMEKPDSELAKNPAILLNGDAHCKASLLSSSLTLPIVNHEIASGKFGSVYFVDFDGNRPRKRTCHLCVIGG